MFFFQIALKLKLLPIHIGVIFAYLFVQQISGTLLCSYNKFPVLCFVRTTSFRYFALFVQQVSVICFVRTTSFRYFALFVQQISCTLLCSYNKFPVLCFVRTTSFRNLLCSYNKFPVLCFVRTANFLYFALFVQQVSGTLLCL